jgi:hypothetical protein
MATTSRFIHPNRYLWFKLVDSSVQHPRPTGPITVLGKRLARNLMSGSVAWGLVVRQEVFHAGLTALVDERHASRMM